MEAGKSAAKSILAEAKATPAAKFAKATGDKIAPTEVQNVVGSMLKTGTGGATRMRSLVQSVAGEPEALDGLRKAATNWIVDEHLNADGTLSPAKLISFLRDNRDPWNELFPHDQRTMFGALARDAEAGIRWRTATAIKGGSDSVKNLLASLDKVNSGHAGHVTLGVVAVEAIGQGLEHAGWQGAAYAGTGAAVAYLATRSAARAFGTRRTCTGKPWRTRSLPVRSFPRCRKPRTRPPFIISLGC